MHLLLISQYYPPEVGAPQTRLSAFAREIVRRGHQVTVVTAMPNYPAGRVFDGYRGAWLRREEVDGVRIVRVPIFAATGLGWKRLLNYLSFALTSLLGAGLCRGVNIVFVESPPLFVAPSGWLASVGHRAPLVLNISDLWPDSIVALGVASAAAMRPLYALERFLYRRAALVCGTSPGLVRRLQERKNVPEARTMCLPNGADLDLLKPGPRDEALASELGLPADANVLLYAGLHGYAQGLGTVLEAAALLRKRSDLCFLFVGDGPEKPALIEKARSDKLDNVLFVEARPFREMPRFYSLATASIIPLIKAELFLDTMPSKLVVSLACGVPVIFSGEGEGAELLRKEKCGLVAPPQDAIALAACCTELVDDQGARARLAEPCRRVIETRFSWPRIVEGWLARVAAVGRSD